MPAVPLLCAQANSGVSTSELITGDHVRAGNGTASKTSLRTGSGRDQKTSGGPIRQPGVLRRRSPWLCVPPAGGVPFRWTATLALAKFSAVDHGRERFERKRLRHAPCSNHFGRVPPASSLPTRMDAGHPANSLDSAPVRARSARCISAPVPPGLRNTKTSRDPA
jgi:hypothetical protein